MKKTTRIILSVCLAVLFVVGVGVYAFVSDSYHADETAWEAMACQTDSVQAELDGNVTWFVPEAPTAGLIFYPGGKVENTAYAPLMRACAENGILCALVRMPGNLAVLDANAAAHEKDFDGLILLAAYSTKDLSQTPLRVLSVYGSEDGVMNRESYEKNGANLPADTTEVLLDGGCHAQFGSYGPQDGDGIPTISGEEQVRQTAEAIAAFIGQ